MTEARLSCRARKAGRGSRSSLPCQLPRDAECEHCPPCKSLQQCGCKANDPSEKGRRDCAAHPAIERAPKFCNAVRVGYRSGNFGIIGEPIRAARAGTMGEPG